jgi:hypothetical protein
VLEEALLALQRAVEAMTSAERRDCIVFMEIAAVAYQLADFGVSGVSGNLL